MKLPWMPAVRKGLYAVYADASREVRTPLKTRKKFRENRSMTTEEVFTDIYLRGRWGGAEGEF